MPAQPAADHASNALSWRDPAQPVVPASGAIAALEARVRQLEQVNRTLEREVIQHRLAEELARGQSHMLIESLGMLAEGKSNRAIGQSLFITESTVKSHLKRLFVKLDVTSRTEAIALAAKRGLIKFLA